VPESLYLTDAQAAAWGEPPLPGWIDWRQPAIGGGTPIVLHSLPRRRIEGRGGNGETNCTIVRHYMPHGADAWRVLVNGREGPWRPLAELPESWRRFLKGERPCVPTATPRTPAAAVAAPMRCPAGAGAAGSSRGSAAAAPCVATTETISCRPASR